MTNQTISEIKKLSPDDRVKCAYLIGLGNEISHDIHLKNWIFFPLDHRLSVKPCDTLTDAIDYYYTSIAYPEISHMLEEKSNESL